MKDDLVFLRLWDLYSPLLTATQREISDLYFNYDLSLGEIAEQKGVSRQSQGGNNDTLYRYHFPVRFCHLRRFITIILKKNYGCQVKMLDSRVFIAYND